MTFKRAFITVLAVLLLPGLAYAQTQTRATFEVTKNFTDGNDVGVSTVAISCNTGLPLDQDADLEDGESVEFVVVDFDSGDMDCVVSEGGFDDYDQSYSASGDSSNDDSNDSCEFFDVSDGDENFCDVDNDPQAVEVVIEKIWVVEGNPENSVSYGYDIDLRCDGEITSVNNNGNINNYGGNNPTWHASWYAEGPGDETFIAFVIPDEFGENECDVEESAYDSAVETTNSCGNGNDFDIDVGGGPYLCVVTNTVFFEGIPTLSQYGLAIMALLMLGVGFVGFRRLV